MTETTNGEEPRLPHTEISAPETEGNHEREKLAVQLLTDLIRVPSVTDTERECEPTDVLAAFFEEHGRNHGITSRVIEVGGKRNFVAEFGEGGTSETTVLNAHFDVVPAAEGMFNPRVEDGVIYGRGACDDKGGLVAMAVAMIEMAKAGDHRGKVVFCAVNSEENYNPRGTEACIEERLVGKHVIVAEPTNGGVVVGHAGQANFVVEVEGTSVHSSMPGLGRNAIHRLDAMARRIHRRLKMFHDPRWPRSPTCTITKAEGGNAGNVVPGHAEARFNARIQESPDGILDQAREIVSGLNGVTLRRVSPQAKPCVFKEDSDLVRAALRVAGKDKAICVSWASDARSYVDHPYSAQVVEGIIVYGPGDIRYSHGPQEHIKVADLVKAIDDYQKIINQLN